MGIVTYLVFIFSYFLIAKIANAWMTSPPKIMLGTFSRKMLQNISFIRPIFCKIHGIRRDRANNFPVFILIVFFSTYIC